MDGFTCLNFRTSQKTSNIFLKNENERLSIGAGMTWIDGHSS